MLPSFIPDPSKRTAFIPIWVKKQFEFLFFKSSLS
jgi:hypothetical protein